MKVREIEELSKLYSDIYVQLTELKHFVYSTTKLSELDSLAALFSEKIRAHAGERENAVWLVTNGSSVEEKARNGILIPPRERRALDIGTSDLICRVLDEQLVTWPSKATLEEEPFCGFKLPVLFPIKGQPKAVGFVIVECADVREREFYQFTAQFMGLVLNMAALHQQVKAQEAELGVMTELLLAQNALMASLQHVCVQIVSVTDCEQVCRIVAGSVVTELGAGRAAVFMLDEDCGELTGIAQSSGFEGLERLRLTLFEESLFGLCIESGRIISSEDHRRALLLGPERLDKWRIFPFKARGRIIGLLVVEMGDIDISDPIAILINHASMVLDNLMLLEAQRSTNEKLAARTEELTCANELLERLSTIDHLTALHNHRFFTEHLGREFERAVRYNFPLALIVIDIDRFKLVNDRYGHAIGDLVLRETSTRIRRGLRQSDVAARYGGDEITIILPGTDLDNAALIAERLRVIVSSEPLCVRGQILWISISTGVAAYPCPGVESREDLFHQADRAMYEAKKRGKESCGRL